jgi:response regulator of citrate/malate metabolism
MECDIASTEQEAMDLLKINSYDLVIVDIYLPDSTGNFIGYLVRKKHRIIIITASKMKKNEKKLLLYQL